MAQLFGKRLASLISSLAWEKTASSLPHLKAVCNNIEEGLGKRDISTIHVDGYGTSEWIVMDYFDVIVHIFLEKKREFYDIEDLYADAQISTYRGPKKKKTIKKKIRKKRKKSRG
jgi:ribosome-associated protein